MKPLCLTLLLLATLVSPKLIALDIAKLWVSKESSPRALYESALIKLALEKTKPSHGEYSLILQHYYASYNRVRRAVADGKSINILINPPPANLISSDKQIKPLSQPVMKGLLGYRQLLVRKEDLPKFQSLNSFQQFQKLSAGQVGYWADIPIYEHNKIPVAKADSPEKLFTMLTRQRFDYLPLSTMEWKAMLNMYAPNQRDIVPAPSLLLHYEFPVYIYISEKAPDLFKRIERGLNLIQESGDLNKLQQKHFRTALKTLADPEVTIVQLPNPKLPNNFELNRELVVKYRRKLSPPKKI